MSATLVETAYPQRERRRPLRDWLFRAIHTNKLVYNTCWEDPRCDRNMLELDGDSEVVMITSAGDNALDYLLDGTRKVNCIDVNPRQNALLELKQLAYQELDHADFFQLFGQGCHKGISTLFFERLQPKLSAPAAAYWADHLRYFVPSRGRSGLYFHGSSGCFAFLAKLMLGLNRGIKRDINHFFAADNLEEQRARYFALEPRLLDALVGGSRRQRISMSFLGVPAAQRELIENHPAGMRGYIQDSFRRIFVDIDASDNYFYRLYLNGCYDDDCHPNYLAAEHFDFFRQYAGERIERHTTTVSSFLQSKPGTYSHFVLLDHQDWLYANAPAALVEEWELVLANSRPGTRILLRSAAERPETVPGFVRQRTRFRNDLSAPQHRLDRVGTYAGTFLLEVL